jgi:hypothetical protein
MPISIVCKCGQRMKVPETLAGKRILCDGCRTPLSIPGGAAPPRREPSEEGRSGVPRRQGKKHRRDRRKAATERPKWPWVAGGVGVLVLLVLGVVGLVWSLNRGEPAPAQTVAQAPVQPAVPARPAGGQPKVLPPVINTTPEPQPKPPPVSVPAPLSEEDKKLQGMARCRLALFGPARFEDETFKDRPLTGVVVEVEGLVPDAVGRFEATTVTAHAADRKVPAAVVFIAGGRSGLKEKAQILPTTTGRAGDVHIGPELFRPWPVGTFGTSARSVGTPGGGSGRVHLPPGEKNFDVGDFLVAMPVLLEQQGGVIFGFVPGKPVRLGFLFSARVQDLTRVKLLGSTLELDPGKRVGDTGVATAPEEKPGPSGGGEIYHFRSRHTTGKPTRNVRIYEENDGGPHTSVLGNGVIGYATTGPGVMALGVLIPGSTDLHVAVNRKLGYTTAAGLRFLDDAIIDLLPDGIVKADRPGVRARDQAGAGYRSREVALGGRKTIVMVRVSGTGDVGVAPPPLPPLPPMGKPPAIEPGRPVAERTGWYAVKATGGEPRLLVEQQDRIDLAVTRDLKSVATFGMARQKDSPRGKARPKTGMCVDIGAIGKPPRTIWTAPSPAEGPPLGYTLRWSAGGQHLLLCGPQGLWVISTTGRSRAFGNDLRSGILGDWHQSRWAGRGEREVAIRSHGITDSLIVLNPTSGQHRVLSRLPSDLRFVNHFDLSEDLGTIAVTTSVDGSPTQKTAGVWIGRRGQQGFVQFVTGHVDTATLSPNGKYLAVTTVNLNGNQRTSAVYDAVKKTELWNARLSVAGYAFDPVGKRLAITTHDCRVLVTPVLTYDPTELVKGGSLPVGQPLWSANGQEIAFRRLAH